MPEQEKKVDSSKKEDGKDINAKIDDNVKKSERVKFKNLSKEQKNRIYLMVGGFSITFTVVLVIFCSMIYFDNVNTNKKWFGYLSDPTDRKAEVIELSKHAQKVTVGTYVENIRTVDMKNSECRIEMLIWFDWEGDPELDPASYFRVYKGVENKKHIVEEMHDGRINYQLVSLDVTISKNYHTMLFPLDSHQIRIYVESIHPIQEVVFRADKDNSGMNEHLEITGFEFSRIAVGEVTYRYNSTHGNPRLTDNEITSEIVTQIEIQRSTMGLFFKCFIALYATIVWILISLYICTYHHVNPLGMVSGALFGAVGNIVIGANLLPDGTSGGLLEFGNIWGVLMVLGGTISIISINRVRDLQDKKYAKYYGRFCFYIILGFTLLGLILLPAFALM